jgi:putative oxidoreductase
MSTIMPTWADFDLTNGINILRMICGLFFIPHIVGKFTEPATLNLTFLTIGLVFAIATPFVAVIAAFHMFVAAAATHKVTKKWIWVIGGTEYCVFWMICCIIVAMETWPR